MSTLKRNPVSFDHFAQKMLQGYVHARETLKVDVTNYPRSPYNVIEDINKARQKSPIAAILDDLEEFYFVNDTLFFDTFEELMVMEYEEYYSYRFCKFMMNAEEIMHWFNKLNHYFEPGADYTGVSVNSYPFTLENVELLLRRSCEEPNTRVRQYWNHEDFAIIMEFLSDPEFLVQISFDTHVPIIDYSPRTKGTILNMIDWDYKASFLDLYENENHLDTYLSEAGEHHPTDEIHIEFTMIEPIFGIFEEIEIIQHNTTVDFSFQVPYDIEFISNEDDNILEKAAWMEKLIAIYGPDSQGFHRLGLGEMEFLEEQDFGTFRHWQFNQYHGLYRAYNPGEKLVYEVEIMKHMSGLNCIIRNHHNLVSYFKGKDLKALAKNK